jgi:hypothetical protein
MYSVPLFFTAVRQLSASSAGQRMIPGSLMGMIGSLGCGFIVRHTGKYYWLNAFTGLFGIFATTLLCSWSVDSPE